MKNSILVDVIWNDPAELSDKIDRINKIAAPGVLAPQLTPQPSPTVTSGSPVVLDPIKIPVVVSTPPPPVERVPWFQMGDVEGKPGDLVKVPVYGWCSHRIEGFHIGGGVGLLPDVSGYGQFRAVGVTLGQYLHDYLLTQGAIEVKTSDGTKEEVSHHYSAFQFIDASYHALPEEFWEYFLGFYSLSQKRSIPPILIPPGTELFRLKIEIHAGTPKGQYTLTCKDEHFWTHDRVRRRDYMYNYSPQGFTKVECISGKLTVV